MEVGFQKGESSDIPKKSRSLDLKSVYAEKSWRLDQKSSVNKASKGLQGKNSASLEGRSLADGRRRKRSRKEASLSSFGPVVVKKRRNGLNPSRLKPNGFSSGIGNPEKLSNSRGSFSDDLQHLGSDSAVDTLKKLDHGTLSIASSSGLVDGVIIPKKPRCVLRQRKLDNTDVSKISKDDCDHCGRNSVEPLINELHADSGSPSQVFDAQRRKKSTEFRDDSFANVASPSPASYGQWKNKSLEAEVNDEFFTDVASPSQVVDCRRKKNSTEAKDKSCTAVASSSQGSNVQRKKKSIEAKDGVSTASPSQVLEGPRKKKSTAAKVEFSIDGTSPFLAAEGGQRKKKTSDHKSELCADIATTSQVSDGKEKKKPAIVKDGQASEVVSPPQASNSKKKKKFTDVKNQLSTDVTSPSQVSHVKRKKNPPYFEDNGSTRNSTVGCIKGEKEVRRRKKNSNILSRGYNIETGTSLADNREESYGDFLEDDLEQNAARMLSSRFDPSCTGFLGSRGPSLSKSENGFHDNSKVLHRNSFSVDAAGRMLRPRKRNGKSLVRKRRHFYEVSYRDMDPYCMIKQRIRVFWPLDQSWYFGLVKDYDPMKRLHFVKYDDRDEEWINLQTERFKLLLFPSEISGKFNSRNSWLDSEQYKESDKKVADDSFSNCTESEPIIAWLTRSKQRRKLSASNMIKKRAHTLKNCEPSLSDLQVPSGVNPSNLFPERVETSPETPDVKSISIISDRELPFVYFRKKFHRRREELDKTLEQDSVHVSSAASINILASVADNASVLEELHLFGSSMEHKRVTLMLSIDQLYIHDLACPVECSLWHALIFLQFGKLTNAWPMVHMEILLVDNVLGLKLLLFEGSLWCAARILCFIIKSFCQPGNGNKFQEVQTPFTSIGINFSGLHDQGGELLFLLYRFFGMKRSKWRYVEDKLQRQCVTVREVPLLECKSSTFKNIRHESSQMLHTSIYKNAVSLENVSGSCCLDILHRILPAKKACLEMNPAVCYIGANNGRPTPFTPHFSTEPRFIMSLHLKLLLENNEASVSFQKQNISSQEYPDCHEKLTVNGCSPSEDPSGQVSDISVENLGASLDKIAAGAGKISASHLKVDTDSLAMSSDGDWMRSSHNYLRNEVNVGRQAVKLNGSAKTVVRNGRLPSCSGSCQDAEKSSSSFSEGYSSPEKSEGGYGSYMNKTDVHVGQIEQSTDKGRLPVESVLDLAWEVSGYSGHSLNPTAPRSVRHCNAHSSVSPKFSQCSKFWQEDFMRNGFASGLKKPRTLVSYSLPFGGYDLGSKRRSNHRKPRSFKKIRTDDAKRLLGVSANSQSNQEQLICNANVLVTAEDKGWREWGAQVAVGSDDHKDWRICVKLSGVTKYAYKAQHIIQPGITNRYTHAMMWKGGKDWTLEFTDRSQWSRFKEIHEECYNRNMRSAFVKNIPIPGVQLMTGDDYDVEGVPSFHSSSKYYRQVGTEVDMALDPAHLLYDMDSDDEEWVSEMNNSKDLNGDGISKVTDDMFERTMDIFEKFSYAQQCNEFSSDEIEEFMADVGPLDIVKTIYEYWRQKRLKKGMALIRQFQPACWVRYQQQLKEWESSTSKMHCLPEGSREKSCPIKKPPMFAFCLRPRGLDVVPNKLLKQRSHKKLMSTGSHNSFARDHDEFHTFGRRTNGLGDERALTYESSDSYHSNDGTERYQYPELYRSNSKKRGSFSSPRDSQMVPFSNNKRLKNGTDPWGSGIYEPYRMGQIQRDGIRRHRADVDEFKLRDASNAAQHALNMARMKREKAQWLLHKTDLAIHKANVALMIAEAMKESKEADSMDEDDDDDDDV